MFISPPPVKPEGTIGLHSVSLSVSLSVCLSHSFSGLFFAMLSHIWMKVGSKLLYEELQIKFNFRHGWPIFSWVIVLCSKFVFRTFLAHLSQRLKWAIVIAHRPSSVRPSSVRRPSSSVRKLSHFRLLLWNRWTEFNETWQEARSQRPLPSLCFSGRSEKQDGRPGLWLAETFSTSPLKLLNGI